MTSRSRWAAIVVGVLGAIVPAAAHADPLALTLGPAPALTPLVPGISADYSTTMSVTIASSGINTVLTVADVSGDTTPGRLRNPLAGTSLATPMHVSASSTDPGVQVGAVDLAAQPLALLTYPDPIADGVATLTFTQHVDSMEPLQTGSYQKAMQLTLSTTSP